jgi:alkanesulfonate monooxygenase SsuD/methylene tetrahydromethanopterin reductase-like flavin-dependent oxidoreductase (luciferase family)
MATGGDRTTPYGALCQSDRMLTLRFAMRSATTDPDERAGLYGAALDMCAWAESRGALMAVVSQHHGVADGYLPSPVPMAAAIAGRTSTLSVMVAALLLAHYEPVKLAEDMVVVDLISRGRVSYVVGVGYRQEEFDLFGVDRTTRGRLVESRVHTLRELFAGRAVEVDGRTARVTPAPFTPGGPVLAYGGGSEAAARRAGRLGMLFVAEREERALETAYLEAAAEAGVDAAGCLLPTPGVPLTTFVSDDPDRAWSELGPYLLLDATGYGAWNQAREGTASVSAATTVDELRAERGAYQVLTAEEAAAQLAAGQPLALQPLVGGLPPDVAWPYLEAAAAIRA